MKKCFLYIGLVFLVGILMGCRGERGDRGDTGITGQKGDTGDKGETGATPEIWMYYEVFPGYDSDGLEDSWEFTLSETVPFTTSTNRVLVSLEGYGMVFDNLVASGDIMVGINSWEVTGGNTIKISGDVHFADQNYNGEPYTYAIGFSVMAYDYSFKVTGKQMTKSTFKELEKTIIKKMKSR